MRRLAVDFGVHFRLGRCCDDDVADRSVRVEREAELRIDFRQIEHFRPDEPRFFPDRDHELDLTVWNRLFCQHANEFDHRRQSGFIICPRMVVPSVTT